MAVSGAVEDRSRPAWLGWPIGCLTGSRSNKRITCKLCHRLFSSRQALIEHTVAKHGVVSNKTKAAIPTGARPPAVVPITNNLGQRSSLVYPVLERGVNAGRVPSGSLSRNSGIVPPHEPTQFNTLKDVIVSRLGYRPDGCNYFMKALHPMDEECFGGCRIPDATTDATVALELRETFNFSAPSGSDNGWDLNVYFPPFPDVAFAYAATPAGGSMQTRLTYVMYPATGAGKVGDASGDSMTLTNQPVLQKNADSWRGVYRGATFQMTASDLNNDGEVYAGQYGVKMTVDIHPKVPADGTDPGVSDYTRYQCDTVPLTSGQLSQKCAGYVQLPAKQGLYLPIRYTDPVHLFQDGNGVPYINGFNPNAATIGADTMKVAAPVNFMMGVVLFRGLNNKATIALKCRTGLEAIPDSTGTWGAFAESSPMLDDDAIKDVIRIRHGLALAYPASYNDLSAIWGAVQSALSAIAKPIREFYSASLPYSRKIRDWNVPGLSHLAGYYTTGAEHIVDLIDS